MLAHEVKTPLSVLRLATAMPGQPAPLQRHTEKAVLEIATIVDRFTTSLKQEAPEAEHVYPSTFDVMQELETMRARKRATRPPAAEIARRVTHLLDLIQLPDIGARYPSQLSGGQRQRVALARALAIEPRMLLLDEPFGALDAKVRKELRQGLRDIHDETGLTTVFVTHDQEEAMELADLVVVMSMGRIEQIGKPADIRTRPATAFVKDFITG